MDGSDWAMAAIIAACRAEDSLNDLVPLLGDGCPLTDARRKVIAVELDMTLQRLARLRIKIHESDVTERLDLIPTGGP